VSIRLQATTLTSISFPLRELCLALYLGFVQWHFNRQVSIIAGNEDEKHVGESGIASGSESIDLVSRAHIYSETVLSEETGALPRLGSSSVQCMKKHP